MTTLAEPLAITYYLYSSNLTMFTTSNNKVQILAEYATEWIDVAACNASS